MQEVYKTCDQVRVLSFDLLSIRKRLMEELSVRFLTIARTFAKGRKWRPGGNKPYLEILVALCRLPDSVVTFDKVLSVVPDRRKPGLRAVRPRIGDVIYDPSRGSDLRRQLAFDPDSGFTIEDPLFRYFLTNLDLHQLFSHLGIEEGDFEKTKVYPYDLGFSFAGETRVLVEALNEELKAEDVVTFYDYDVQAFLLAQDLEETLRRVYSASCRYYLVLLDTHYRKKVWTRFERDIMTTSGRKDHIIPVVLDDDAARGVVGVSGIVGHVDLRDVWRRVQAGEPLVGENLSIIRNRCAIPVLEKLGSFSGDV